MDSDTDLPPFPAEKQVTLSGTYPRRPPNGTYDDDEYLNSETEQTIPMIPSVNGTSAGKNGAPVTGEKSVVINSFTTMQKNRLTEEQPAPTGMLAWVGFGCCVFALACLSISFASPYWLQTWPMSENPFRNIGLWHVCFHNYMQFRDDSQQIYNGCWWLFDMETKYYKLRQWLIPPWFISCQVLVVGCLVIEIATTIITAMIFLHCCPMINHEYLQTYGMFASASMMFLVTMISIVVAILFGVQTNDRYWLPRPDQNYLSWGFGFLIISAIMTLASGICLFMEARKTYNALLAKEDEYTKAAFDMSTNLLDAGSSYPPGYDSGPEYGPASYGQSTYGPDPTSYAVHDTYTGSPTEAYAPQGTAYSQPTYDMPSTFSSHPSYERDPKVERPLGTAAAVPQTMKTGKSWQRSFDDYNDEGPGFV